MTRTDLHDLLERAVEPLDTMPDAVPEVLSEGRRSVRRRRIAAAAGTIAGAAAGIAAVIAVSTLTSGTVAEAPVAGSSLPTARSTAPSAPATPTGRSSVLPKDREAADPTATPPELITFSRDVVAPALDRALPRRLGTVTINRAHGDVGYFTISAGAKTYEVQFFVSKRPVGYPEQIFRCSDYTDPAPGEPDRFASCTERTLPDGMRAVAVSEKISQSGPELVALRAMTIYRDRLVELSLYPSETAPRDVPISRAEMLDALADPELAAAYHQWATHPGWPL
jgi:hypothetical protein